MNTANDNTVEYELDNSTRQRMSAAKKGCLNPNFGKPRDEETKRKISQSQTKRHSRINAFNEVARMAATRRTWVKTRWQGYCQYQLIDCHDVCAMYSEYDLKNDSPTSRRRVFFFINGVEGHRDFEGESTAREFFDGYQNPHVEFLVNETKTNVVVLGLLR